MYHFILFFNNKKEDVINKHYYELSLSYKIRYYSTIDRVHFNVRKVVPQYQQCIYHVCTSNIRQVVPSYQQCIDNRHGNIERVESQYHWCIESVIKEEQNYPTNQVSMLCITILEEQNQILYSIVRIKPFCIIIYLS